MAGQGFTLVMPRTRDKVKQTGLKPYISFVSWEGLLAGLLTVATNKIWWKGPNTARLRYQMSLNSWGGRK